MHDLLIVHSAFLIHNQMKTLRNTKTEFLRTGYGEEDITEQQYVESETRYTDAGDVLEERHFNADGVMDSLVQNEYDAQNRVISSSQFDENEELTQKNTFEYNDEGKVVKKGSFYGEGSPEFSTHYVYENGLLVKEDSYTEEDFDYTEKSYEYDENGRMTCQTDFDEEGKPMYRIQQKFDEAGLVEERIVDELQANDRRHYVYEYDGKGQRIKELVYNFNEKLIAKTYYEHNEAGHVTQSEEENLDNYIRLVYTFVGDACVKIEQFDKKDALVSWTDYLRSEDGKEMTVNSYIRDEVNPDKHRQAASVHTETISD